MAGRWEVIVHSINDAQRNRATIWIAVQESSSIQTCYSLRDLEANWHSSLPKSIFRFTIQLGLLKETWMITTARIAAEHGGGERGAEGRQRTRPSKNHTSELSIARGSVHKSKSPSHVMHLIWVLWGTLTWRSQAYHLGLPWLQLQLPSSKFPAPG